MKNRILFTSIIIKRDHDDISETIDAFLYNSKINNTLKTLGILWISSLIIFSAIGAFFAGLGGA